MKQSAGLVPKKMEDLGRRLGQWRSTHKRRGQIPEALWAEAADLAREHGVYQTACPLRLGDIPAGEYLRSIKQNRQARWTSYRDINLFPAWVLKYAAGAAASHEAAARRDASHTH